MECDIPNFVRKVDAGIIVTRPAVNPVDAESSIEVVVAGSAIKAVIAAIAVEMVVAGASGE